MLPAESVTAEAVAEVALQTPTSTTRRLAVVTFAVGVTVTVVLLSARAAACWMKLGGVTAVGVTELEASEGALVPMALVAVTVKV